MKTIDCHTHLLNEASYRQYDRNFDKILTIRIYDGFAGGSFDGRDLDFDHLLDSHPNLFAIEAIDINLDLAVTLEVLERKLQRPEIHKIKGIKLYTGYQPFYPQEERLFPLYELCGRNKLPVVFHSGQVQTYKDSTALLKYAHPGHVDEVATRFPDTTFVISHLGFPHMMETASIVCKNPNVYTDISGLLVPKSCYAPFVKDTKKLLRYYPNLLYKLMFGTDFMGTDMPHHEVDLYIKFVERMFSEEEQRRVFYENAKHVYGF